jgi:hypothetical protein
MYDDGASEELFYQEFMDTLVPNILRTFNGEPLSGPKVTAFAANLFGDLGRVTVDSWMLRAYTGNMKDGKLDDYTYECIERDVVRRTHEQSKKGPVPFKDPEGREGRKALHYPAEYQAAVWTGIKLLKGDPNDVADPFGILIRAHIQERQMKLAFDENDPDIPGSFAEFERLLGPLPKTTKREKAELELRENPPSNYVFYYDPRKVALK